MKIREIIVESEQLDEVSLRNLVGAAALSAAALGSNPAAAQSIQPPQATTQQSAQSYGQQIAEYVLKTDKAKIPFKLFKNKNGMVLVSKDDKYVIYLGKDGDAASPGIGKGTWGTYRDLITLELAGKTYEFFDRATQP